MSRVNVKFRPASAPALALTAKVFARVSAPAVECPTVSPPTTAPTSETGSISHNFIIRNFTLALLQRHNNRGKHTYLHCNMKSMRKCVSTQRHRDTEGTQRFKERRRGERIPRYPHHFSSFLSSFSVSLW